METYHCPPRVDKPVPAPVIIIILVDSTTKIHIWWMSHDVCGECPMNSNMSNLFSWLTRLSGMVPTLPLVAPWTDSEED